jgi:hypothetical protein
MTAALADRRIPVLFVRPDSIYFDLPAADPYDAARNALAWSGGSPVVAHPPCRLWGRLRHFSTAPDFERFMAIWAVAQVRRWGGVLEHPAASSLWPRCALPRPGAGRDECGGWTLPVDQIWWGHRARKPTWLYICGIAPRDIPAMPYSMAEPRAVIARDRRGGRNIDLPHVSHREREATPPDFASWLVDLASRCEVSA